MTQISPATRANARRLRAEMTPQELRLWGGLREINQMLGTHFRRQAPIGQFIADFADYGRRLVIEVDGGQHGGAGDGVRDAWLAGQGFVVLRFWNNEVDGNIEGVMQVVLDAVEAGAAVPPPLTPPHAGEGKRPSLTGSFPLTQDGENGRGLERPGASPPPCGEGLGEGGEGPMANQKGATP